MGRRRAVEPSCARTRPATVRLVKGSHIVVRRLYEHDRCYIFQNADGRIFFAIPYENDFTLIGTTDRDYHGDPAEVARDARRRSIISAARASEYFASPVTPDQVVWTYSGVRPLYDDGASAAQAATRDYVLTLDAPAGAGAAAVGVRRQDHHLPAAGRGGAGTARAPPAGAVRARRRLDRGRTAAGRRLPADGFDAEAGALVGARSRSCRQRWPVASCAPTAPGPPPSLGDAHSLTDLGRDYGAGLTEAEVAYLGREEWATRAADVVWRRSQARAAAHAGADRGARRGHGGCRPGRSGGGMSLVLEDVGLGLPGAVVLDGVSMTLERGTLNVLLGPTLSGKTSLMRLMGGLDRPDRGRILLDGADVTGVPVRQRSVAMVYQQFVNYPTLSVYENIASPLRVAGLKGGDRGAGRRGGAAAAARAVAAAAARRAVGRAAAAHRDRPGPGEAGVAGAVGRAARQPRLQAAGRTAGGVAAVIRPHRRHPGLCDDRAGRGAAARWPHHDAVGRPGHAKRADRLRLPPARDAGSGAGVQRPAAQRSRARARCRACRRAPRGLGFRAEHLGAGRAAAGRGGLRGHRVGDRNYRFGELRPCGRRTGPLGRAGARRGGPAAGPAGAAACGPGARDGLRHRRPVPARHIPARSRPPPDGPHHARRHRPRLWPAAAIGRRLRAAAAAPRVAAGPALCAARSLAAAARRRC